MHCSPRTAARGHDILFLERDMPWYARNRDLPDPGFCRLALYDGLAGLQDYAAEIAAADAVLVGSYVPDGIEVEQFVRPRPPASPCSTTLTRR